MDVDENLPVESIFTIANSYHNKKSHMDPSSASTTAPRSIDLASNNEHRYHLHQIPIEQLMASASLEISRNQPIDEAAAGSNKISRKNGKDGICVQLPNTGRFVYASSKENMSDIYRALGKEIKDDKSQRKRGNGEQDFDSDSLRKMNDLAISAKEAETSSSGPSTSKPVANGKPDTVNKNNFTGRPSVTKPAVHASRAAAMARMAAMGEEWPEEEELPGMTRPNQTSAINSNTGSLSRDANKQYNDAMQRTKKVVTAKRKG